MHVFSTLRQLPHGIFLREAVEDYVREASQTVEINLFKVDVWRHPGDVADKRAKGRGSKSARLLGQQSHLPDKVRIHAGRFAHRCGTQKVLDFWDVMERAL